MTDLFSLQGSTAVVTGAARGLGKAMAIGLAEAGADIILVLRSPAETETQAAIEALGRKCTVVVCDLADGGAVSQLIGTITASHSFDILVNNAGIQRRSPAALFPQDAYEELMQVNVSATFALCRDTGKFWIDHGIQGRLINIASLASFQGGVNIPAYAASKGAVAQLTKAFSNEWAKHGIRVNAIAPGSFATDLNLDARTNPNDPKYSDSVITRIPVGRWGTPDDLKGPVVFLAASRATVYVSGEILTVDGGWLGR